MRSPHERTESMVRTGADSNLYEDYLYSNSQEKPENIIRRIIRACSKFCNRNKQQLSDYGMEGTNFYDPKQMYPFAELELKKMLYETTSTAVQTGDSLELSQIDTMVPKDSDLPINNDGPKPKVKYSVSDSTLEEDCQKHVNELSMLKFFKDVKSESMASTSREVGTGVPEKSFGSFEEEEELQTHLYEVQKQRKTPEKKPCRVIATADVHTEKPKSSKLVNKRLRFDEEAVTIPYDYEEEDEGVQQLSASITDKDDSEKIEEDQPSGKDFKRFWKNRKSKKKAQLSLR